MKPTALYQQTQRAGTNTDALVNEHALLVKRIAYHMMGRLPASVQLDDLLQAGMIGLLDAARNYDANQGAAFETYAGIRIRGAMIDELRRYDWTPRSVHRKAREIADAIQELEAEMGREVRDIEVAEKLNMDVNDYHAAVSDSMGCRLFSLDELFEAGSHHVDGCVDQGKSPIDAIMREQLSRALAEAIEALPERERYAISLYYDEELNLREIGEVLGVSESRVCQIQGQAMLRLRSRLQAWMEQNGQVIGKGKRSR